MSRSQRLHIDGGTYYVVQRSGVQQPMFRCAEDYKLFERLLSGQLRSAHTQLHGYCWTPTSVHLALQIGDVPLGRMMQVLTSTYARAMQRRAGESGHFFRERYRAALIDPATYLPRLVRYVHHIPVLNGDTLDPALAQHTSHRAYTVGSPTPAWLTTSVTRKVLQSFEDVSSCESFMQDAPLAEDIRLFSRVSSNQLRIIAGDGFLQQLPRKHRNYRSRASLDDIIQTITALLGIDREAILSDSRQRDITLARALIVWYADKRGVAKLSEVARYLGRHPSTLSVAVRRHAQQRPELFRLTSIHDIGPLVPLHTVAAICNTVAQNIATGREEWSERTATITGHLRGIIH